MNLHKDLQERSDGINLLNTTELKKLLDANGDGKAVVKFNQVIDQAKFILDYGLYANLVGIVEVGKFKASIGAKIDLGVKEINAKADLIDTSLFEPKKLQLLKDFKVSGGSKSILLSTNNFNFSKAIEFNVPTNADDLIKILGINTHEFYEVSGGDGNDNLVTRTEQGDDIFKGYGGNDIMTGGRGNAAIPNSRLRTLKTLDLPFASDHGQTRLAGLNGCNPVTSFLVEAKCTSVSWNLELLALCRRRLCSLLVYLWVARICVFRKLFKCGGVRSPSHGWGSYI